MTILQEDDETGQGLCMPSEISCCDEEEAVILQSKLDTIIAELRDIKSILCKHQVIAGSIGFCMQQDCLIVWN